MVLSAALTWRQGMECVHKCPLTVDEHTQELHHTLYAHGLHDLQPDYREIYGSGPEPYLGWDYFINLFLMEHDLDVLEDQAAFLTWENRQEVWRALWPKHTRREHCMGPTRDVELDLSVFETHIMLIILKLTRENPLDCTEATPDDWNITLRFRHQRLSGLIRLF